MHGEADEQYRQVGVRISRRSHRCSWIGGWRRWQTPAADGSIGVVVSEATTLDEALAVALPGGDVVNAATVVAADDDVTVTVGRADWAVSQQPAIKASTAAIHASRLKAFPTSRAGIFGPSRGSPGDRGRGRTALLSINLGRISVVWLRVSGLESTEPARQRSRTAHRPVRPGRLDRRSVSPRHLYSPRRPPPWRRRGPSTRGRPGPTGFQSARPLAG